MNRAFSAPVKSKNPMKKNLPLALSFAFAAGLSSASAANLLLDFGPNAITSGSETLSPGHAANDLAPTETAWNTVPNTGIGSLSWSDGTAADGVTLALGAEATSGNNIISYTTGIANQIPGNGGSDPNRRSLLGAGSIYGSGNPAIVTTTAGRGAIFTSAGSSAIGLRVDGLEAGEYRIYVMARNTNSNANGTGGALRSMNVYAAAGASGDTFSFLSGGAASAQQSNTTYATGDYVDEYERFILGENYVAIGVTLAGGESLFLAVDGNGSETRGFLNAVQIVQIPEPSAALLGAFGFLALFRRRR